MKIPAHRYDATEGYGWKFGQLFVFTVDPHERELWSDQLDKWLANTAFTRADLAFDSDEDRADFLADFGDTD